MRTGRLQILSSPPTGTIRTANTSKRLRRPRVLEVDEFFELFKHLGEPYRTVVLVAQCLGLRVSEILGLQWGDFNFDDHTVSVHASRKIDISWGRDIRRSK
jgi:integrase